MLKEIEEYVSGVIKNLSKGQIITLKALIHAGYRGEREKIVAELIKAYGGEKIETCELIESFTLQIENKKAEYFRILPEYYRAVRKVIFEE